MKGTRPIGSGSAQFRAASNRGGVPDRLMGNAGIAAFGPLFESPRRAGEVAAARCAAKAEHRTAFDVRAAGEAMLAWLRTHGQTTGEVLVNLVKGLGHIPHDDRAFGAVFLSLVRANLIRCTGYAPRAKGHGTAGARIWEAT